MLIIVLSFGKMLNVLFLCACVISSAHRSWCCRLWSHPDFHPGPSGDRSPVCKTTWSLCPSAVVLHTKDTTHITFKYISFNIHHLQLADLCMPDLQINPPRNGILCNEIQLWHLRKKKYIVTTHLSSGISSRKSSQAHPIYYSILRLILLSLSLCRLNKSDKLLGKL